MSLMLYNTLTRKKELFQPLDPANVRMYVCGPTVYDFAHIGNARPVIVFDVLFRLLKHIYEPRGAMVTYVRNITDVDDKINDRAAVEYPHLPLNDAIRAVTEKTEAQFHADVQALGCLKPSAQPRATEHIKEMKEVIERLVEGEFAYVAENHVLFQVSKMANYGRLSRRSLDEMIAGARVDVAPYKKEPMDFVLWKPSKVAGKDGANFSEPGWPSPCGIEVPGRPGWHIECSAMSWKHLGEKFDIHGGGIDLLFPHHENEVAQNRCAFGQDVMANIWMHNGFLQVEGQKMSKSLGNFVTINELLKNWPGDVLRFNMLRTHYRQPIDWTMKGLEESRRLWISMGNAIRDHLPAEFPDTEILAALSDDLNSSDAIVRLNILLNEASAGNMTSARKLRSSLEFMGFFQNFTLNLSITYSESDLNSNPFQVVEGLKASNGDYDLHVIAEHFEKKFAERAEATTHLLRKFTAGTTIRDIRPIVENLRTIVKLDSANTDARSIKNYAAADAIRSDLFDKHIVLKINKDSTTSWEVKR